MSDWDFLHEMSLQGYSQEEIWDAAACGYNIATTRIDFEDYGYSSDEWEAAEDESSKDIDEVSPELISVFEDLVKNAKSFYEITHRYLQIWGELGELYAEITFGIKRYKPHTKGSDGRLGKDFVEIKTISPEKNDAKVKVKRSGNFNKLLIIKINEDFTFDHQFIERKKLKKGDSKHFNAKWEQ